MSNIWADVAAERARAHAKHAETSMEETPVDDLNRLAILLEEVGEVAREFNEARHTGDLDLPAVRRELIQTAAMAGAWADSIGQEICSRHDFRTGECINCGARPTAEDVQCDGDDTDDCALCGSGDWNLMCDDCRFYAAQDAEPITT